jgi:hypothetical protein
MEDGNHTATTPHINISLPDGGVNFGEGDVTRKQKITKRQNKPKCLAIKERNRRAVTTPKATTPKVTTTKVTTTKATKSKATTPKVTMTTKSKGN